MAELTIRMTNDDDQVSKVNEIGMMEELQKFFEGRNVYLASFFRPELVDWATYAIENDVAPDIWADRMYCITVRNEAQDRVHNLRAELETTTGEYDTQYENITAAMVERDEKIIGLKDHIETLEHINDSLRGDLRMAREALGDRDQQISANTLRISTLQLEVIELKAKLWDALMESMPE